MAESKVFKEEFISKMSEEILKEIKEDTAKEGRDLTFDDIENAVLLFRHRIGEDIANKIIIEQGTGELIKKKPAKNVDV